MTKFEKRAQQVSQQSFSLRGSFQNSLLIIASTMVDISELKFVAFAPNRSFTPQEWRAAHAETVATSLDALLNRLGEKERSVCKCVR